MGKNKTFIKITNIDIWEMLNNMDKKNDEAHADLLLKQNILEKHQLKTNGRVTLNKWVATTALTCALALAGWFITKL